MMPNKNSRKMRKRPTNLDPRLIADDAVKEATNKIRRELEHKIHEDGTYSNRATNEIIARALKDPAQRLAPMTVFKTKSGSQYQIMETRPWGAWVTSCPYDKQPRVDECPFWTWEEIEEKVG